MSDTLVGNGPLLVFCESGEIVVLPSNQSVKRSISAYQIGPEEGAGVIK
jgi:hypothetical protein